MIKLSLGADFIADVFGIIIGLFYIYLLNDFKKMFGFEIIKTPSIV